MKTTFKQPINWMWIETVKDRKNLVVVCDGYDFKRSIVFVTDCTTSRIPDELVSEIMDKDGYKSLRMGILRYLEHIENNPDDNEISNMAFFKTFFKTEDEE